jgi:hypothetical protein
VLQLAGSGRSDPLVCLPVPAIIISFNPRHLIKNLLKLMLLLLITSESVAMGAVEL